MEKVGGETRPRARASSRHGTVASIASSMGIIRPGAYGIGGRPLTHDAVQSKWYKSAHFLSR